MDSTFAHFSSKWEIKKPHVAQSLRLQIPGLFYMGYLVMLDFTDIVVHDVVTNKTDLLHKPPPSSNGYFKLVRCSDKAVLAVNSDYSSGFGPLNIFIKNETQSLCGENWRKIPEKNSNDLSFLKKPKDDVFDTTESDVLMSQVSC